jgi:hypothetical protein
MIIVQTKGSLFVSGLLNSKYHYQAQESSDYDRYQKLFKKSRILELKIKQLPG